MKIVIPTYKRLHRQLTLQSLYPLRDIIWLVVRPEEEEEARKIHPNIAVLPENVIGIAPALEWICREGFKNEVIWVCDDDLRFGEFTYNPQKSYVPGTYIKTSRIKDMYTDVCGAAEIYAHGGVHQHTVPVNPKQLPYVVNSRYCTNKWYNLRAIDASTLDFTSIPYAEDFNVMLQLYSRGYDWITYYKWGVYALPTNAPGGCSESRTIEQHNASMQALHDAFPQYTHLKTKMTTTGPWAGKNKLGITIKVPKL